MPQRGEGISDSSLMYLGEATEFIGLTLRLMCTDGVVECASRVGTRGERVRSEGEPPRTMRDVIKRDFH